MKELTSAGFLTRLLVVIFGGNILGYILRDVMPEYSSLVTIVGYLASSLLSLLFVRIEGETNYKFLLYPLYGLFTACVIIGFTSLLRSYPDDNGVFVLMLIAVPILYSAASFILWITIQRLTPRIHKGR